MNKIKYALLPVAAIALVGMSTSCQKDPLDLGPEDYYGSRNYWKSEAHVVGYADGLHSSLRDYYGTHTITFGELRSGIYVDGTSSDGMTTTGGDIRLQNFDADHTGVTNYANIFGRIINCNLLIARAPLVEMDEAKRNFIMAQAYGLRAFYYFDLYRNWGGVPLRLDVAVIDGELDPQKLYMPQAKPSEVMAQIKSDLTKSLELFGSQTSFDPYSRGAKKGYWSKAATEALAADVYLWNGKVSIGDNAANPADLAIAKQHLNSLLTNYGLGLESQFTNIFATNNKGNKEVIIAIRFQEGEATNHNGYWTYSGDTGAVSANGYRADGTRWNDPLNVKRGFTMAYEYIHEMYNQFDAEDTRRNATFYPSFLKDADGNLTLYGLHTQKNIGSINSSGDRVFDGDYILYRLPWVYLSLAEIANYEGNDGDVVKYINLVRERAYGANWDVATYGYTAGDFTQNELAILKEKDKEFIQEGQRWWDLRRMTLTKNGTPLVFTPEGNFGKTPLLNQATESHKLLWPLDKTLRGKEKLLEQTPGYAKAGE